MGCVNRKTATIEVNKKNPNQQYDVLKEEKNIPIDQDKKENNNNQLKKEEINDNETAKKEEEIKLPQKESKCFGAVQIPPIDWSPSKRNGYIVIETQYGYMLVSSCL